MKVFFTDSFKHDFERLPQNIQKVAQKNIELFGKNPRYPSLRVKKMEGTRSIWEGRVTGDYRFTFQIEGEIYILRRIGTHDILKKETKRGTY